MDSTCRDVCFKLVHDRLLTNNLLYTKNMSKTRKCMRCNIETLYHLFIQCSFTKSLNRAVLYFLRLILDRDARLSLKWFKFLMLMLRLLYKNMLHLCFCLNPETLFSYIGIR